MVAQGLGHGSTPRPDTAPARLREALRALDERQAVPRPLPEVYDLLGEVGARAGGITGVVLGSPWLVDHVAMSSLLADPLASAVLTDTVHVTGFGGALEPNVVPSEVWAQIDARILPGTRVEDLLAELEALVDDEHVRFEVISAKEAQASPVDDPVYRALDAEVRRAYPDAAVGPLLMMGSTDSVYFRELGVHAYGLALFPATVQQLGSMHGHNERLGADALVQGVQILFRAVLEVAAEEQAGR